MVPKRPHISELRQVQMSIASKGISELQLRKESEHLARLWNEITAYKNEINAEKARVVAEVEERMLPSLIEMENQYAFVLKLSS